MFKKKLFQMKFNKFLSDQEHWLGEYGVSPLTHKKGKAGSEALGQEILPIYSVLKEQGNWLIPSYVENVSSLILGEPKGTNLSGPC